eukprot:6080487-Prymnesium_polylepis.1
MARYEYRMGMLLTESPLPSAGSSTTVVEASGLGGVAEVSMLWVSLPRAWGGSAGRQWAGETRVGAMRAARPA